MSASPFKMSLANSVDPDQTVPLVTVAKGHGHSDPETVRNPWEYLHTKVGITTSNNIGYALDTIF